MSENRRAVSLAAVSALVLPFCLLGLHASDTDVFYHLAAGRWMAENGRVLGHETFSFVAEGRPWTNYYWAFERLLYGAYAAAGYAGVLGVRGVFMVGTVGLLAWWIHRRTDGAALETLAFGLLFVPVYVSRALNPRPHLASYLLLAATLVLLDAFQGRRRGAAAVLVLCCGAWANLHGVEYPVVLAVVLLHALDALRPHFRRPLGEALRDRAVWRWPALLAGCAAAFLASPFGPRLLLTPKIAADREVMAQIVEMQPVPLTTLFDLFPRLDISAGAGLRYAAILVLALLPGWLRRGELLPAGCATLGLGLALHKQRFAVEFLVLALPFVAARLAALRRRGGPVRRPLTLLAAGLAAFAALSATVTFASYVRAGHFERVSTILYPHGAVRFAARHGLRGNMHCEPTLAGYVTWHLHPAVRVTIDMRTPEPFGAADLWLAGALGGTVPFDHVAERWPIDLVLLARDAPLAGRLRADGAYALVYADPWFVLFAHRRALAGKEDLALRTLDVMEGLESGRLALPGAAAVRLREEAERLVAAWEMNNLGQRALLALLLAEGRAEEALRRAAELERRHPRQGLYPFFAGLSQQALGRPEAAVAGFRRALERSPHFPLASAALSEELLRLGRAGEARAVMEARAHGRWPTLSADEYLLLGRVRLLDGRRAEAADAFSRAAWLLPPGSEGRARAEALRAAARGAAREPAAAVGGIR